MQAQTTTRMAGTNGFVIAVLAIALAVLISVAASKVSEIGQSSDSIEPRGLVQSETISDPPAGIGPETSIVASAAAGSAQVAPRIEDLRFLELNTILPDYGSASANRLSANEILFLESNLLLPGMDTQEEVRSAEETLFIEMNTHLPGAQTGSYVGKLPRE